MAMITPGAQRGISRQIRKAGQLHGQDRRDYKAAQEAGRGKSFMRNFQREAQQMQEGIAKEAAPLGYRPQQPQQPQQQRPSQPWSPGGQQQPQQQQAQQNDTGWLDRLVGSGGKPIRPTSQGMDFNFSGGVPVPAEDPRDPNKYIRLPNGQVIGTLIGWDRDGSSAQGVGQQAAASIQGYPGVVNDMMNGKYPGSIDPGRIPGMAQGFGGRMPWGPGQRSQTRSPGIGLDGRRINYSGR